MVESTRGTKHGTDFIGLRVLCCYFLSALVWVLSVTVNGYPAGHSDATQNFNTIVQYIPTPVTEYGNSVIPDWNKNPSCYVTVSVSGENGTQYISKPLRSCDCRIIFEKRPEQQCFSDTLIAPITTNINGRTYYLVKQFQHLEAQIQLWSVSSAKSENGSQIDLLTRTVGEKTEYLEALVISENGRSVWSTEPPSSTTILVEGNHCDYVAQTSDTDHWIKLYEATRQAKYTSTTHLRSLVMEVTEQMEGRLYYLIQQFQSGTMQFQLWSTASADMAGNHQVVDLVRRRVGTDTSYLKSITIWGVGLVSYSWQPTPPSFVSIFVETRSRVKYIAEIRKTVNQPRFYTDVAYFSYPRASFFQDVTQVTTNVLSETYYLLDIIEDNCGTYIQLWSSSPVDSENGTQVHLVIKKGKTFTEYLKELSVSADGIITRTWSNSPSASTVFRIIDETGTALSAPPTSKTVIRYLH